MKRVIKASCGDFESKKQIKGSVDWSYFNQFGHITDRYLPMKGEGETLATQLCTAINKLVYKWYNDGDVFDNTYYLEGWANDLSSYANWMYKYIPASKRILGGIRDIDSEGEYEDLLRDLVDGFFDAEDMENLDKQPKQGSVYDCDGPFKFKDYDYDDDDEDEYDEYDEYEDEDEEDW